MAAAGCTWETAGHSGRDAERKREMEEAWEKLKKIIDETDNIVFRRRGSLNGKRNTGFQKCGRAV